MMFALFRTDFSSVCLKEVMNVLTETFQSGQTLLRQPTYYFLGEPWTSAPLGSMGNRGGTWGLCVAR